MFFRTSAFSPARAALIVGLAAFAIRAIAGLVVFEDRTYFSDEKNYLARADTVAEGNWLGSDTIAPPGPVYFLALCRAAGLGLPGIRLVQAALGGVAAGLLVLLASSVFGLPAALLAGGILAVYPYLVYVSGVLYTQNVVIPLLLLIVLALYRRQAGGGAGWLVAAGLGWGAAGMFAVPSLLTAPFLGIWHAFRMPARRRGILDLSVLAAVAVLSLVPVTLRNYAIDGRFVFISSMGGRAFYWANNPGVDPSDRDPGRWVERNILEVEQERLALGFTQVQMDSLLSARAATWVRENPGRFLGNYARRAVTLWSFTPHTFTENEHTGGRARLVAGLSSGPVILLSLLGMLVFIRRIGALFPFYAVPLAFTLVFSLFHTTVRYRLTVEPFLIALAAVLLLRIVRPSLLSGAAFGHAPERKPARARSHP